MGWAICFFIIDRVIDSAELYFILIYARFSVQTRYPDISALSDDIERIQDLRFD